MATDEEIRTALDKLRGLISARVRAEQRTSQRTGLPNQTALEEAIHDALESGSGPFWLAFVEVDQFKRVNDRFGTQNADVLLTKIGEVLGTLKSCFSGQAVAFHAHGDEFYLMGDTVADTERISKSLDLVRQTVAEIRVTLQDKRELSCTVSVGWLSTADIQTAVLRSVLIGSSRRWPPRSVTDATASSATARPSLTRIGSTCALTALHAQRSSNFAARGRPTGGTTPSRVRIARRPSSATRSQSDPPCHRCRR